MIRGEKVSLRALEEADLPMVVKWLNDEGVSEHLLSLPMTAVNDQAAWLDEAQSREERVLAIETLEGELIGDCGIYKLAWEERSCHLWIMIGDRRYWDKGYGTDAVRAMLAHLFDEMNLHRVQLTVAGSNARAIRAYEKCGFRREGTLRSSRFKNGGYRDDVVMAVLRGDLVR